MFTRKQYMAKECTHREYYGQFVTDEIKQAVLKVFSKEKLVHAFQSDEHFNNLPLYAWDRMIMGGTFANFSTSRRRTFIRREFSEFADAFKEAGNSGISLADCVCTCKEAARQIIEEIE